jgi:phage terminase large subunit
LTIGIDEDNNTYVVDEYYVSEQTIDAIVEYVDALNEIYKFHRIYADPSAVNWIETARLKRLRVYEANNDIDSGLAKCKAFFKNDIIHIDRSCEHLIREIESYRYERDKFNKNLTERPIKKNDHAVDALRYAFTEFNPWHKKRPLVGGRWR